MEAEFYGAKLYGSRVGNAVYVALKPIVEAMGVAWHGQLERVKRDPILSEGIRVTRIPSTKGLQEAVSLRLDLLPGWLFRLSSLRIKDQNIRSRIELFQRECYAVLAKHFLRKQAFDFAVHREEMRSIHLVNAAYRIGGRRAALQIWRDRGLPDVPALDDLSRQGDLFDRR